MEGPPPGRAVGGRMRPPANAAVESGIRVAPAGVPDADRVAAFPAGLRYDDAPCVLRHQEGG